MAIFSDGSQVIATNNNINNMSNGGIYIWNTPNPSANVNPTNIASGNVLSTINSGSGDGPYGNAIDLYVASFVQVTNNVISNCEYSAVRFNTGTNVVIANNLCSNTQSTCIFIEAPGANTLTNAVTVSGNVLDNCSTGITVTNEGFYNDGVTRSVAITGNHIMNMGYISVGGTAPTAGMAFGIHVEAGSTVTGNVVDTVSGNGVEVGINSIGIDLVVSGNYICDVVLGIGVANGIISEGAGNNAVVSNNIIRSASGGAIVATSWIGNGYATTRVPGSTDYGNATLTSVGDVTFVANRAS
jgi:uncharacterized secreted repeat protein (TIGR03808 family)